jgi:hypothetical protein
MLAPSMASSTRSSEATMSQKFRSMSDFDPNRPALVHDQLSGRVIEWSPSWATDYTEWHREYANGGAVAFNGLLLDGWLGEVDFRSPGTTPEETRS